MQSEDNDLQRFLVLLNDAGQYSLWPQGLRIPGGWRDVGKAGTKAECVAYVDEVWTDMRPLPARRRDS